LGLRQNLLAAVCDVRADAVIHELTALGTTKMRQAMQGTNALRTTGTEHLLAAARAVGAHRSSPSRSCSATATGITDRV
jgi:hypothetical protein